MRIAERVSSAASWFGDRFSEALADFIANIHVDTDNSTLKKQITRAIDNLRQDFATLRAGIGTCADGFSPSEYLRAVDTAGLSKDAGGKKAKQEPVYTESDIAHPELFNLLREWRSRQAKEQGVPHFHIMHQRILVQIVIRLPDSIDALLQIKGVGAKTVEKYGEDLVEIVSAYRQEHGILEVILPEPANKDIEAASPKPKKTSGKSSTKQISFDMYKKGIIGISLDQIDLSDNEAEMIPVLQAGQYLKLSVSDTGQGMDDATKERIFDPFFTTKGVGQGTGMGLATVHGIMESYLGAIKVESEPGKRTTFHLYFPIIEDANPQEENVLNPEIRQPDQIKTGTEKILFVDDEPMFMETGMDILESLGYTVTAERDSREALKKFQAAPQDFDLVITDQIMPYLSGDDLTKEFLAIRPDIPIILCTGHSDQIDEEKAKSIGIKEYVMKPIGRKDISQIIRKVLGSE